MPNRSKTSPFGFGVLFSFCFSSAWAADSAIPIKDVALLMDIDVAQDSSVWLLGIKNLQHLSADGKLLHQFEIATSLVPTITNLALASDNSIWLVNVATKSFQHYSPEGTLLSQIAMPNSINNVFDIKTAADGSVWVADTSNNRVLHYKADGTLLVELGSPGTEAGQLNAPAHLTIAKDGSLWVTDGMGYISDAPWGDFSYTANFRVQHFSAVGRFINQFVIPTKLNRYDNRFNIGSIAAAADGSVWVADKSGFKHFQANGTLLQTINSYGLGTSTAEAYQLDLASDGSLWTVSYSASASNYFVRHLNLDGNIATQFKSPGLCASEYDDLQKTVYLWGVAVGTQHNYPFRGDSFPSDTQYFDAVLQWQNGRYTLVSAIPSTQTCANTNLFLDINSKVLNIPYVQINNATYSATFLQQGNATFTLLSAQTI